MTFYCPKKDLRHGFTFIELLVVIAISAVLFTIGIASYNNFNESRTIEKYAEELKSNIRLVQSKAINNEKPDACGANSLLGWFLAPVIGSNNSYKMYCQCQPGVDLSTITITLSDGVIISPFTTIQFRPLGGGTNLSSDAVIIIQGFGKQNNVTVAKSGDVEAVSAVYSPLPSPSSSPSPSPSPSSSPEASDLPVPSPSTGGCFTANVKIFLTNGKQSAIKDVKIGDQVLAFDKNYNLKTSKVKKVYSREINSYVILYMQNNQSIETTNEHPFLTPNGFKLVENLIPGDEVYLLKTNMLNKIKIIQKDIINEKTTVYNLEVDNFHTYFANNFAVHNKLPPPPPPGEY